MVSEKPEFVLSLSQLFCAERRFTGLVLSVVRRSFTIQFYDPVWFEFHLKKHQKLTRRTKRPENRSVSAQLLARQTQLSLFL